MTNEIDWVRVAEPQSDAYDTHVALQLASSTTDAVRTTVHRRPSPRQSEPTIFDGAVAVRASGPGAAGVATFSGGPSDAPVIEDAVQRVRAWPEAFRQFQSLMHAFYPVVDSNVAAADPGRGSCSHSVESAIGEMYATVFDPIGLAEAFVHEMAHNKLRALGVYVGTPGRFFLNPRHVLYPSPALKTRLRPMSAVFHAEYSFIYVTQLDIVMLRAECDPNQRAHLLGVLATNVERMDWGLDIVRDFAELDDDGATFMRGFYAWAERVLNEGRRELRRQRRLHAAPGVPL
ncbi:MAG: HEXXH motif-containing putative peptide modification protein [Myxococcota bacterium]